MKENPLLATPSYLAEEPLRGVVRKKEILIHDGIRVCSLLSCSDGGYMVKEILAKFGHPGHIDKAVVIYSDNTAAIAYAKDLKFRGIKKTYIDTRLHFIWL